MKKFIVALIAIAVVVFVALQLLPQQQPISEEQLAEKIRTVYNGTLIDQQGTTITFETTLGEYKASLTDEGQIVSVEQLTQFVPPAVEQPPTEESPTLLTKDEAIAQAIAVFPGTVEQVEFIENDAGGYFLIELENDTTEAEAEVEVHAITGEVLSIVYDD